MPKVNPDGQLTETKSEGPDTVKFNLKNCQKHGPPTAPVFSAQKRLGTENLHASNPQLCRPSQTSPGSSPADSWRTHSSARFIRSLDLEGRAARTMALADWLSGSFGKQRRNCFDFGSLENDSFFFFGGSSSSSSLAGNLGPSDPFISDPREPCLLFPPSLCVLFKKGLAVASLQPWFSASSSFRFTSPLVRHFFV